jgi:hypothetical protein
MGSIERDSDLERTDHDEYTKGRAGRCLEEGRGARMLGTVVKRVGGCGANRLIKKNLELESPDPAAQQFLEGWDDRW